jgi:oligogalacturonide transport system permease protein
MDKDFIANKAPAPIKPMRRNKLNEKKRRVLFTFLKYFVLIAVGIIMVYPLVWMVGATFKSNNEIFSGIGFIPKKPTLDGYKNAMNNYGGDINIWGAMLNTYLYVIPRVIFTVASSTLTAYGFGRFNFIGKRALFALLMSTLFLPQVVLNVPQYILYNSLGWINSPFYLPIIIPTLFAVDTYFVFMLIQFLRNIPRELDEASKIDGCNSLQTLVQIIVPMLKPAMVSCALFQFMWSSNDFMSPLLYVNTPKRYPATIFVKLSMDADTGFDWNRVLAVSLISIIPQLIIFFAAQNTFVEGISAGGVKG